MTRCDGDCYLCTGDRCRRDPAPSPHEGEAARCEACEGTGSYYPGNPCKFCHGTGQRPAPTEGEAARCDESLGEWNGGLCEYGCEGECDELSHWRLRFAYLLATAPDPSPHARCETCGSDDPAWDEPPEEEGADRYPHDPARADSCPDPFHAPAPTEPRSISEEALGVQIGRVERLRDQLLVHVAMPRRLDGAALDALLAAYEQAEARALRDAGKLGGLSGQLAMAKKHRQRAEAERDTAQASEARLREALALARGTMLRQMGSDGATGAPFNEDMDEAITAASVALASTHKAARIARALASTPNPEEPRYCESISPDKVACNLHEGHGGQHEAGPLRWPDPTPEPEEGRDAG